MVEYPAFNRRDEGSSPPTPTKPEYVWVVYSKTQDECTMCNRAFADYNKAAEYRRRIEKDSGCLMMGPMRMIFE